MARIFVLNGVNLRSLGERRPEVADSEGLIVNPGAWTHYSYAIHDALEVVSVPKVQVHLSNVHSSEEVWRHTSVISAVVDAVVAGMGVFGYRGAADYILSLGMSLGIPGPE